MKCTKIYNARAQLLCCSLNLLYSDVLVAVVVVICLGSRMPSCVLGARLVTFTTRSRYFEATFESASSFVVKVIPQKLKLPLNVFETFPECCLPSTVSKKKRLIKMIGHHACLRTFAPIATAHL